MQVPFLGRAPRTKETLPDFLKWSRVTRPPLVFRGLTGSQRTPGFWGVTVNPTSTKVICFSRFFYAFLCLWYLQTCVRVLCFVCIGSWSFGVRIALRLSCWIPDFVRKVLTIFEIFSQPDGPVGKLNQQVHWVHFSETSVWVLFFVCIGSWSFGVGITLRLSCWIPDFVRKVLTIFETFSKPYG